MASKDISIIVPIYNAEKYLEKCIDSLVNQTKREIEIILINDGSTDSSEEIIKSYKDKRIKYYKNPNQGIGKTRNFGISKATGKYLMFVDSDDYISLDACEKLYNYAKKNNLDLVVCDFYKVYDDGRIDKEKLKSFKNTKLKDNKNLLLDINLAPWNKLYKKELLTKNNISFVENLKYEDAPFVIAALDKADKIGKLDQYINYYAIHQSSETTIRDERVFDIIKIVDMIRKYFFTNHNFKSVVDILTVQILTNYNIQQRYQENKQIAMKFINESFKYMSQEVPDYRSNKYYKNQKILKRMVKKSKILTKLHCKMYR